MSTESYGYVTLSRGTLTADANNPQLISPPGSGSTITLWSSEAAVTRRGCRWKRVVANIFSSHASAANGLIFEESSDDGANWQTLVTFSILAATYTKNVVAFSAPGARIRYINSANVLTAWQMSIMGDPEERTAP